MTFLSAPSRALYVTLAPPSHSIDFYSVQGHCVKAIALNCSKIIDATQGNSHNAPKSYNNQTNRINIMGWSVPTFPDGLVVVFDISS